LVQLIYPLIELLDELALLLELCLKGRLLGFGGNCGCGVFEIEEKCARMFYVLGHHQRPLLKTAQERSCVENVGKALTALTRARS